MQQVLLPFAKLIISNSIVIIIVGSGAGGLKAGVGRLRQQGVHCEGNRLTFALFLLQGGVPIEEMMWNRVWEFTWRERGREDESFGWQSQKSIMVKKTYPAYLQPLLRRVVERRLIVNGDGVVADLTTGTQSLCPKPRSYKE